MYTITYSDLFIPELDQNYIDKLIDERDVDCSELEIWRVFDCPEFSSAKLTNAIIWEIFHWIIMHNVQSWLDISADEVESEEAKDLVRNFNW